MSKKITCQLTIVKVPVPPDYAPIWRRAVANLYDQLEEAVRQDKQRAGLLDLEEAPDIEPSGEAE